MTGGRRDMRCPVLDVNAQRVMSSSGNELKSACADYSSSSHPILSLLHHDVRIAEKSGQFGDNSDV
jgi:hypothetical protein